MKDPANGEFTGSLRPVLAILSPSEYNRNGKRPSRPSAPVQPRSSNDMRRDRHRLSVRRVAPGLQPKEEHLRRRFLICVMCVISALVGLPFTASAAAPNIGRISATSYVDLAGSESFPLCGQYGFANVGVSYSGFGPDLGGAGSGALELSISGPITTFIGTVSINGDSASVEGLAAMICTTEGSAILYGDASVNVDGEFLCGNLSGSLTDGVHRNQGRLSLLLSGFGACDL